jgi:hypothetical protein
MSVPRHSRQAIRCIRNSGNRELRGIQGASPPGFVLRSHSEFVLTEWSKVGDEDVLLLFQSGIPFRIVDFGSCLEPKMSQDQNTAPRHYNVIAVALAHEERAVVALTLEQRGSVSRPGREKHLDGLKT